MKSIFFALLFFVPSFLFSQVVYTAGISYTNGTPAHNPGNTGSKYAIDTSTWDLYVRSYGTTWSKAGDWLQFRTGTGTPAAPPTKFESVFAINAADSLYYYDGATWNHLNPASTGGATDLSFSGASSPVTLESSTGTDVTITAGTGISLAATGTDITITNSNPTDDITGSGLANRLAYWTAAGAIGYESTLRVDSTNNRLMIGSQTVAPATALHVVDNNSIGGITLQGTSNPAITFISSSTTRGHLAIVQPGPAWFSNAATGDIALRVSSGRNIFLGADDGTGVARPALFLGASKAAINGTNFTDPILGTDGSFKVFTASNQSFTFTANTSEPFMSCTNGTVTGFGGHTSNTDGMVFGSFSNHGVALRAGSNVNRLKITTGGDVSIGTNFTATARLDVRGSGATSATNALDVANSNDSTILLVRNDRRVGINTTTPDCELDVTGTGGVKITAGTTAQQVAVDNVVRVNTDSTKAEIRLNGTYQIINSGLRSNKALDFPSTAASSYSDLTLTVTGAAIGDVCSVGVPAAGQIANVSYSCFVSATDVVTVRLINNEAAGVADPTSGTFKVFVTK